MQHWDINEDPLFLAASPSDMIASPLRTTSPEPYELDADLFDVIRAPSSQPDPVTPFSTAFDHPAPQTTHPVPAKVPSSSAMPRIHIHEIKDEGIWDDDFAELDAFLASDAVIIVPNKY